MTSENVDANGNLFKKLLNLLFLGSGAPLLVLKNYSMILLINDEVL